MAQRPALTLDRADPTLALVVGRRSGSRVTGGHVNVADEAWRSLRANAQAAIDRLGDEPRDYDPDAQLEEGEYFVLQRDQVEDSLGVLALLDAGAESTLLKPSEVARRPQLFYGSVIGQSKTSRLAFVTKSNPAKLVKAGLFLTPKHEVLTMVSEDIFLFEDRVDLIVSSETLVVFNQGVFEQWFRDTPVLQERVGTWIAGIAAHLPFDRDGEVRLAALARTNSRLRRVLYSIQARGHLKDVPVSRIRRHAKAQGLDPAKLLRGNKLVLDEADPATLLKLLNEDLFLGGLTDSPFVAARKSGRAP